jgi:hypothetical protein
VRGWGEVSGLGGWVSSGVSYQWVRGVGLNLIWLSLEIAQIRVKSGEVSVANCGREQ